MGAEHSSQGGPPGSPNIGSYLRNKDGSRISPFRQQPSSDGIITVHPGQDRSEEQDLSKDQELVRLSEIPTFYPIFRSSLNIPGVKDPPDIGTKLDARPLATMADSLQNHLTASAQWVSAEQNILIGRIRQIDSAVANLCTLLSQRQKRCARLTQDLGVQVREVSGALRKIDELFPHVISQARSLNDLLPPDLRLDPLRLDRYCSPSHRCRTSPPPDHAQADGKTSPEIPDLPSPPELIPEHRVMDIAPSDSGPRSPNSPSGGTSLDKSKTVVKNKIA